MSTTLIRTFKVNTRTRERVACYVASVSWGDGTRVKSVTRTTDIAKAASFSTSTAIAIAAQFDNITEIIMRDGTLLADATKQVDLDQRARWARANEARREFNEAMKPVADELRRILKETK